MKNKFLLVLITACLFAIGCKKNIEETRMSSGIAPVVTLSPTNLVLTEPQAADTMLTITWTAADFDFKSATGYTVQIARSATGFANASAYNTGSTTSLKLLGGAVNELAISKGISAGTTGSLDIRVKAFLSDSVFIYSDTKTLSVKTYASILPALLVQGGNSWTTPSTRTNGFVLTSVNRDGKYEGYLDLPNADGFGGDAMKLVSTIDGKVYGWGGTSTTMAVGGGNLWFTPAPNHMKVNADVNALTVNFTPVKFFISGDHNGWSTSATPMTYNVSTKVWEAHNVSFTAGNKFVFTSNGNYDISYKVDGTGKLVFAGPPNWVGNNIPVNTTGVFKVTLDLSEGDGYYKYSIQ